MGIERLLSLLLGLVVNKRIVHWPGETNAAEYKVTGQNKREMLKRAKMFFFFGPQCRLSDKGEGYGPDIILETYEEAFCFTPLYLGIFCSCSAVYLW